MEFNSGFKGLKNAVGVSCWSDAGCLKWPRSMVFE